MGAKYLNANDVLSKDECLKLCCQTDTCNVFVFEEKSLGTCYLFNCGTPDDFKCNFTHHHNYSSAVLTVNRPLIELDSQISHSQHEQELLRLRKPETQNTQIVETTTPNIQKGSKEILPTVVEFSQSKSKCSRYQFECRSTGECTAIYNACDGIPQCPDGSDEAPELGCPTAAPTSALISSLVKTQPQVSGHGLMQNKPPIHVDAHADKPIADASRQFPGVAGGMPAAGSGLSPQQIAWQQQMFSNPNVNMMPSGLEQQAVPGGKPSEQQMEYKMPDQLLNQAKAYGREGENFQWQDPSMSKGDMHIFTHKGGLMSNYQPPEAMNPANGPQYGEMSSSNINYYNNAGYSHMQPQPVQPNWHRKAIPPEINANNPGGYDYFYEDPRARLQQQAHPNSYQHQPAHFQQTQDAEPIIKPARRPADSVKKANPVDITLTTEMPSSTTVKHKSHSHHSHHKASASHRKVETLAAETNLKILEEDIEEKTVPSGAILSLTLGLCVTALMVIIVGCRMRVIRRRLRRGGKSGYSHDADFLVNGMYL